MNTQSNLVRKQYLVSEQNIEKVKEIAHSQGTSAAEIVRQAIDAYDPQTPNNMEAPDLMALVSETLKAAILSTKKANNKMAQALKSIEPVNS